MRELDSGRFDDDDDDDDDMDGVWDDNRSLAKRELPRYAPNGDDGVRLAIAVADDMDEYALPPLPIPVPLLLVCCCNRAAVVGKFCASQASYSESPRCTPAEDEDEDTDDFVPAPARLLTEEEEDELILLRLGVISNADGDDPLAREDDERPCMNDDELLDLLDPLARRGWMLRPDDMRDAKPSIAGSLSSSW